MAVKIRLQRHGRKQRPFYHIVVADARAPRDGKFIEKLGVYNPMTKPATIELDRLKTYEWLMNGAQPTDTARSILRFKGVLFYKHLMRGVSKGALNQEQADAQWKEWIDAKEARIEERRAETEKEIAEFHRKISGSPKKVEVKTETVVEEKSSNPKAVSDAQKTLAELAAEKEPAELELKTEAPAEAVHAPTPAIQDEKGTPEENVKEAAPAPKVDEEAPSVEEKTEEIAEEIKEESAEIEEKIEAVEVKEEAAEETAQSEEKNEADDLTKVEGIGPKIAELITNAGITTYAALGDTDAAKIKEILDAGGSNFASHDPTTWPEQSKMAAEGKWDELKKWQDELDGGKEPAAASEEE